jgi:aspartyl-tRNA(Asn)/glutamyl-tRNA(Gln) amidotransferase subunit C
MADTLTRADVQRIATLARLELTPDEIALFAEQLTAILAYADQVRQADTSGLDAAADPGAVPREASNPGRDDIPAPCLPRDAVLDQAPDADRRARAFTVPRVLGS